MLRVYDLEHIVVKFNKSALGLVCAAINRNNKVFIVTTQSLLFVITY